MQVKRSDVYLTQGGVAACTTDAVLVFMHAMTQRNATCSQAHSTIPSMSVRIMAASRHQHNSKYASQTHTYRSTYLHTRLLQVTCAREQGSGTWWVMEDVVDRSHTQQGEVPAITNGNLIRLRHMATGKLLNT